MKILLFIFVSLNVIPGPRPAPSQYLEAMQKNIQALYEANTLDEHQAAVNAFERIAQAEKEEWHPLYYATLGYILMSTEVEAAPQKDKYLDQATQHLENARERKSGESELVALEGFIYMLRLTVDPANRGQQYSGLAMQTLSKAVAKDPGNPRALYLLAQMQLGTARFFGSDPSEACATVSQAVQLFESYEPAHPLDPAWGLEGAKAVQQQCQ